MTKKKEAELERVFEKDGVRITLSKTFVYEVQVFKLQPGQYSLEDTKHISSKDFTENKGIGFTKDGVSFRSCTELVGAPLEWLNKNKYQEYAKSSK